MNDKYCFILLLNSSLDKKAGYMAQDAPSTDLIIMGDGRTDRQTDTTSYRDSSAHLKVQS